MNSRASSILFLLFSICLILLQIPPSLSYSEGSYSNCSKQFNCGNIINVDYPFWGGNRPYGCGHPRLNLNCDAGNITSIEIMKVKYRVLDMSPNDQILKIAREDYLGGICPSSSQFVNTSLDSAPFEYVVPGYMNLTIFYGCPDFFNIPAFNKFPSLVNCVINGSPYDGVYVSLEDHEDPGKCNTSVIIPVPQIRLEELHSWFAGWDQVFGKGFEVKWKVDSKECSECIKSLGKCGYDLHLNNFTCFCINDQALGLATCPSSPDARASWATSPPPPGSDQSGSNKKSLAIGIAIGGTGIISILLGVFVFYIRKQRKKIASLSKSNDLPTTPSSKSLIPTTTTNLSQSNPSYTSSRSDLENRSTYFGVQVFSYTELEEATNNFDPSKELGEGGFGTVYYGKLHDGRIVAVKRLYENNFKRVEQFMNEVEILTRLRHQNLVMLYGCTSRRSRELVLVYEYIPNGTVADHLHGKKANSGLLTWPVRLSIAIETADALAYLHASDIIHRDVKSNNILLDNDFRVKVADFGLSRLFPNDVTHVSTAPQGTPGYVDPEYYQCYKLTDKSDVYSFGVVLIELISSKEAVDTNRHRHDINLANMAVNKIQNQTLNELVDPCLGFETDSAVRRMTTSVAELAFRCLQQERDMRPSMEEVLRILREIEKEEFSAQKAEVVDIGSDDIGLLKSLPPPISPDSILPDKWVPNSF